MDQIVTGTTEAPPFPVPRTCPFHPPAEYARLQKQLPVSRVRLWDGTEAWLITRYEDVRAVLTHPAVSADTTLPNFPFPNAGMAIARGRYPAFVSMDNPKHDIHRRMLIKEFMLRRIEALQPEIQQVVDDLITGMREAGPPLDFVRHFALALPSRVICRMLGVPYAMHEFFQERADIMVSATATREQAIAASRELIDEYLGSLIDEKDREPQDDILSRLVVDQLRTGNLTRHELLSMARLLLVAGHETTANTMALSVITLLRHPDQLAALRADPALVAPAVEELLRFLDPTQGGRRRIAVQDLVLAGQLIRAGEGIIALNTIADRDDAVYAEPNRFDIRRGTRSHLAFGFGIHQCLGHTLARTELQIVLGTLFNSLPDLRLAVPFEAIEFQDDRVVYGVKSLPVEW